MVIHISLISILLLTLYIYKALYFEAGSCTIRYFTLYYFPVVGVSDVVNGEIKRSCGIITICCIKSW